MMGLEFLLSNSENIKRATDINGGIYTAKAEKGRFIRGGKPPFGYIKTGLNETMKLEVNHSEAAAINYIFDNFLLNVPKYLIYEEAKKRGLKISGNDIINIILRNPLYMGYHNVKPWRDKQGGLFKLQNVTPIISEATYYKAQEKLNYKPKNARTIINNEFPLRGVVKCHCGKFLTGVPSRGRSGKYYNYYKCVGKNHTNVSADKMHSDIREIFCHLSLPEKFIPVLQNKIFSTLDQEQSETKKIICQKTSELNKVQEKILSIEKKWIEDAISAETYQTWFPILSNERLKLQTEISEFKKSVNSDMAFVNKNLNYLTDMHLYYDKGDIIQKRALINTVFDKSLYIENRTYRTPFLLPIFSHNSLVLKEKQLLIINNNNADPLWVDP